VVGVLLVLIEFRQSGRELIAVGAGDAVIESGKDLSGLDAVALGHTRAVFTSDHGDPALDRGADPGSSAGDRLCRAEQFGPLAQFHHPGPDSLARFTRLFL